jgi:hypothetical protein
MQLFYRMLGLTVFIDESLSKIVISHFIRLNWIFIVTLTWVVTDGVSHLGLLPPIFWSDEPTLISILKVILASSALVLFVMGWFRRNTVFRSTGARSMNTVVSTQTDSSPITDLVEFRLTCRMTRGPGNSIWLRDFPARWRVDSAGTISIESLVEDVGLPSYLGPFSDASGTWNLPVPRSSLVGELDEGLFYWGVHARPAFRLKVPGQATGVIVSAQTASHMNSVLKVIEVTLAESAAKELEFRGKLWNEPDQPNQSRAPMQAEGDDRGNAIPWDKLVDFSN